MKTLIVLALSLLAVAAKAAEVTLAWDAPTNYVDGAAIPSNAVISYRVYDNYAPVTDTAAQTSRVSVVVGTNIYAVTALNEYGDESEYSEPLTILRLIPAQPVYGACAVSAQGVVTLAWSGVANRFVVRAVTGTTTNLAYAGTAKTCQYPTPMGTTVFCLTGENEFGDTSTAATKTVKRSKPNKPAAFTRVP